MTLAGKGRTVYVPSMPSLGILSAGRGYMPCRSAAGISSAPSPLRTPGPVAPMRLLILGSTGFIGPHQVRYALARGHHVTIFNRGHQKEAWPGPVEELLGDRSGDLKALERHRLGCLHRQSDLAAGLGARRPPAC